MLMIFVDVDVDRETAPLCAVMTSPTLPAAAFDVLVTPIIFGVVIVGDDAPTTAVQAGALEAPVETIACPLVEPTGLISWIGRFVAACAQIDAALNSEINSRFIFILKRRPSSLPLSKCQYRKLRMQRR